MTPEQETALQGLLAELQKRKEEGTPVNQPRKPVVSPSATESTYQIMPGDTLSGIAEKQGISIEDLMTVNPNITDPNKIYAGSVLNLPGQPKKEVMIGEEPAEEKPVEEKTDYDLLQEEIDKSNMAFSNLFQSAGINGVNMETSIADIVKQISDLYGFPDINKQLEEIDNKYIDEEVDINNNPWLTESMRSRKITALQQKYEGKREALINRLSTEKSIVGEAINYYYKEKEYQKDLLFKQLSLKSQEIDEKKTGFSLSAGQARYEYNPDTGKYEQVASVGKTTDTIKSVNGGLFDVDTNTWIVPPKTATDDLTDEEKEFKKNLITAITTVSADHDQWGMVYDSLATIYGRSNPDLIRKLSREEIEAVGGNPDIDETLLDILLNKSKFYPK